MRPKPHKYQLLYDWIKNLAETYEISFRCFCRNVLALTNEEINNLRRELPPKALFILSNGTGVPIYDLCKRDLNTMFKTVLEEFNQYTKAHPEEFSNFLNKWHL